MLGNLLNFSISHEITYRSDTRSLTRARKLSLSLSLSLALSGPSIFFAFVAPAALVRLALVPPFFPSSFAPLEERRTRAVGCIVFGNRNP